MPIKIKFLFKTLFVGALLTLCLGALSCAKRDRLSEWLNEVSRPDFHLLDTAQTTDYLIAIYDTGKEEIAFCYKWIGDGPEPTGHFLDIDDDQGADLGAVGRKPATDLIRKRSYDVPWLFEYRRDSNDGIVYPIRPGYHGYLSVRFGEGHHQTGESRVIYERKIRSR